MSEIRLEPQTTGRNIVVYNTIGSFTSVLGNGDDHILLDETEGDVSIQSGHGTHNGTFFETIGNIDIHVQDGSSHLFTLLETEGSVSIEAGNGDHQIIIEDTSNGDISVTTGRNSGVGIFDIQDTSNGDISINSAGGPSNDVDIVNTEDGADFDGNVAVIIGPGPCTIDIIYTAGNIIVDTQGSGEDIVNLLEIGGSIDVKTWDDDDLVTIDRLYGSLFIDVGDDDDVVYIDYLGGNGTVLGGLGEDLLLLDARNPITTEERQNTMDGSHLDWNGGGGDDTVEMYFVSVGTTNLNIVGDNIDVNQVISRCSDLACTVLSRRTFLANIHDPGAPDSSLERINLDETASITTLLLYLNGGENSVHFDDTIAIMDVFGGDEKDSFHIGQMYNDERTAAYGVATSDPITTTLTTRGYLSDGCSHPITLNGGSGNDAYDVLRNKCILDLNGESGDDSFVVRSFIMVVRDDGSLEDPNLGNTTLKGGEFGSDDFRVAGSDDPSEEDVPDYMVNSLVDIDGGTGSNNLTIVGTELGDRYVVKNGLIFGGGLSVKYTNIANLQVTGEAGDDEIIVLSTSPSMFLSIYGGLGSDTFVITPRSVSPVVSKNLRGHRGIIEHTVLSNDDVDYDGLVVQGVEANVMDNDGDYGWVYTVDQGGFHLMTEDGEGAFSFYLYPTSIPEDDVYVNIVAPAARDEQRFVLVNGAIAEILFWAAGEMEPKEVYVTYNPEVMKLDNTEINLMLKLLVDLDGGKTKDYRFVNTEQSVLPVDILLLPSIHNTAGARSVLVRERLGGTSIAEGSNGFDTSYDVYLRPCSGEMLDAVRVEMQSTVPDQIVITPSELIGSHFVNDECKATVSVSAIDDDLVEGNHYTTILHTVQNRTSGEQIMLADESPLYAANVLVTIYDDDTPGVIIQESNGVTATAELDDAAKAVVGEASYYEDEYFIRLTKQPSGVVEIVVDSTEVASDVDIAATPPGRDFSRRKHVLVNGLESHSVIFTPDNWFQSVTIQVTAIDDDVEEGVDWLNFASQPSNLGLIQGPLVISGGDSPYVPSVGDPLMLPHESQPPEFIIPPGVTIDMTNELVYEEKQVDTVIFNHMDAKGFAEGTIIPPQFIGMGMVRDLIILGRGPFIGIYHEDLEVLTFNFGEEDNLLYVNETTEAVHVVNLDSTDRVSNDSVIVRDLSGPMLINGGQGVDIVNVSSVDERKLDTIRALLMFDGGDNEDTDILYLDNSGDRDRDDLINVTRLLVEIDSMDVPEEISGEEVNPIQPRESYLVTLRDATGGTFSFTLNDPVTGRTGIRTVEIPFPPTLRQIEYAIDIALFPDQSSCGQLGTSYCSSPARAWQLGNSDTYFIVFVGDRLNAGVSLALNSENLENYYEEIFLNETNDAIMKNSDVAYTNVDDLVISLGYQGNVVGNIRGTTANHTYIETLFGEDDKFFISSDANENHESALEVEVLYGLLDYIRGDLHIELNSGRHRLFVSDCFSVISKGVGEAGFVEVTNSSILNLGDDFGDIFFSVANGTWLDDFTLWFGQGNDQIIVTTIPTHEINTTRITTTLHAGKGDDTVHVVLDWDEHGGAIFVANGQEGDDVIDATNSTMPMIFFGDGGDDTMYGGVNENVLIGDYGQVLWVDEYGEIVARQGGGGYGDFTDKTVRNIHLIESLYPPLITNWVPTNNFDSGSDIIHGNSARDIIFGSGGALDELHGHNASDIIVGDFAIILIDERVDYLYGIISIDSHNCTEGGGQNIITGGEDHDIIVGGGHSIDIIDAGPGSDIASGDCVWILFDNSDFHLRNITSTSINVGGMDEMRMGEGDDVAIGGQNIDTIYGGDGFDILAGDNSEIVFFPTHLNTAGTPSTPYSFWNKPKSIRSNCDKGYDVIYGGMGDGNYIIAKEIDGSVPRTEVDFVYDDHGLVLLEEDPVYKFLEADACTRFFVPDFSNSKQLCTDNGLVTTNDHDEVYSHHSKKECCETHFWWRVTQCMGNDHLMYYSDSVKCNIKVEFEDWESKFTPGGWRASGLFDELEDCCGAHFWWDIDGCMAASPNDAKFSFSFLLSDLKAPVSCQEADEIAAGWEYVMDNELPELAYSNVTKLGCTSIWRNPDTGMTECGGCLAGLDYVGTTDAIFTEGVSQPESPWNEDDPDGIYHHAHKVLTYISVEVRIFSYECKDAVCFQNLLVETISTMQGFVTSGRFTLAVYDWSRFRGPPIEQLWLAEVDRSSWVQTSSLNPFIVSASSPVGLQVSSSGKAEVQNVQWSTRISSDSMTSNLETTIKTALYSLTGDTRIVSGGMVVEQSLVIRITKICGQPLDGIEEPLQCPETPATFEFNIIMYLPYNAATDEFAGIMEDKLNSITSFEEGAYPISSFSLSDAVVVSFALYYPDWFKHKSCTNDGRQPQYMRDKPDGYLFEDVKDCCKAHFPWDQSCGQNSPSAVWFYPVYEEATCYNKTLSEFDEYDTEKYASKASCCLGKFDNNVQTCCEKGDGECKSSGNSVFVPDWFKQTCAEKDVTLVPEWETDWTSTTIEECCEEYFPHDNKCGVAQNSSDYMFYPDYQSMECEKKMLGEFESWENEIYDNLFACCKDKFPNSLTSCCETEGAGGCALSGVVEWLPDWKNGHCFEKDTNLIEEWETRFSHKTLESCCEKYFGSARNCNRRDLMALKFYADQDKCSAKEMSKFRAFEERYDSLDDCCRAKFSLSMSECCEASDQGCLLSGNLKFIPKWQNQICYLKDENVMAGWERIYSKETLRECCEHHMYFNVGYCCEQSEGGC